MKIAVMKGPSQYGNLRLQSDQMTAALERLGAETHLLELATPQLRDQVAACAAMKIDALYSATVGWPARLGTKLFSETFDCPYFAFSVDPPAYLHDEIDNANQRTTIFTTCHTHTDYLAKVYPEHRFAATPMLPPAGNQAGTAVPVDVETYFAKRDIPFLFTGTLRPTGQNRWEGANPQTKKILDEAAEHCLSVEGLGTHIGIEAALDAVGHCETADARAAFLRKWTSSVNEHIHATRRMAAMKKLAAAGIPVHVYGRGWEKKLYRFKSFTFGGEGSYEETTKLLQRTRIVINTNTNFVAGGHDRVFSAMLAGAAVVSDISAFYDNEYEDGENIAFYRWTDLDTLPAQAERLMNDADLTVKIANGGLAATKGRHDWDARAKTVLELIRKGETGRLVA